MKGIWGMVQKKKCVIWASLKWGWSISENVKCICFNFKLMTIEGAKREKRTTSASLKWREKMAVLFYIKTTASVQCWSKLTAVHFSPYLSSSSINRGYTFVAIKMVRGSGSICKHCSGFRRWLSDPLCPPVLEEQRFPVNRNNGFTVS